MSSVFAEKPNIVTVLISDVDGSIERYVVGKTVLELVALIEGKPIEEQIVIEKKIRKPRRTKAQMAADTRGPILDGDAFHGDKMPEGTPPPHSKSKSEVWP